MLLAGEPTLAAFRTMAAEMNAVKLESVMKDTACVAGELALNLERRRFSTARLFMNAAKLDQAARKLREAVTE